MVLRKYSYDELWLVTGRRTLRKRGVGGSNPSAGTSLTHTEFRRGARCCALSLPELGLAQVRHSKWPKSETSDFGWERAAAALHTKWMGEGDSEAPSPIIKLGQAPNALSHRGRGHDNKRRAPIRLAASGSQTRFEIENRAHHRTPLKRARRGRPKWGLA